MTMGEAIPYKGPLVLLFGLKYLTFEKVDAHVGQSTIVRTLAFKKSILTKETSALKRRFLLKIHVTNKDSCLPIAS